MRKLSWLLILSVVFIYACNDDVVKSAGPKPAAMGVMNEIVVIAENDLWKGMVGDTFQYYFASAYPIMPEPEPFFDIRHFSTDYINAESLRKNLRSYVILGDLSDEESSTTKMIKNDLGQERFNKALSDGKLITTVGRDKWARGQVIIYILGRNEDELVLNIRNNFSAVAKRIQLHDQKQLKAKIYARNINKGLSAELEENLGIRLELPGDYREVSVKSDYKWYRRDLIEVIQNIAIKKIPYTDANQLSSDYIKKMTNDFGKFVETDVPESYLLINDRDLPTYHYNIEIDGNYAIEVRGIWEISNDFMGGPFASYLIHNKEKEELLFVTNFIFAPGKSKRNFMQQLEFLVKSITFKNE